jgi:hypothetical protein
MLNNSLFYWMVASVDTSCTPLDTSCTPVASVHPSVVAGDAPDVMGWQVMQLFYHLNFSFILLPLELENKTSAALILYLELLPPPPETGKTTQLVFCLLRSTLTQLHIGLGVRSKNWRTASVNTSRHLVQMWIGKCLRCIA